VDVAAMLEWLQRTSVAVQIRDSLFTFPVLESIHVVGLALVFGTIAILDLRLLGVASTDRPVSRLMSDLLKWTWAAFAADGPDRRLMFSTNAARLLPQHVLPRQDDPARAGGGEHAHASSSTAREDMPQWRPSAPRRAREDRGHGSLVIWGGRDRAGRVIGFTATPRGARRQRPTYFEELLGLPKVTRRGAFDGRFAVRAETSEVDAPAHHGDAGHEIVASAPRLLGLAPRDQRVVGAARASEDPLRTARGPHVRPTTSREGNQLLLLRPLIPFSKFSQSGPRPPIPVRHLDLDLLARIDRRGAPVDRIDRLQALDEGEGISRSRSR
jgi:hypothetical protein